VTPRQAEALTEPLDSGDILEVLRRRMVRPAADGALITVVLAVDR
jgi:hypothetical protein